MYYIKYQDSHDPKDQPLPVTSFDLFMPNDAEAIEFVAKALGIEGEMTEKKFVEKGGKAVTDSGGHQIYPPKSGA